jgi:hypothetical protein
LWTQPIVQITAQTAAFFLARQNQLFARALQVSSKAHCMDRNSYLRSQIIQQT